MSISRWIVMGSLALAAAGTSGCGKSPSQSSQQQQSSPQPSSPQHSSPQHSSPQSAHAAQQPSSSYRWEVHRGTNMKIEVPSDWSAAPNGNVLVVTSPTPGVGVELVAATGGLEAKADEKAMLAAVGALLSNARFTSGLKPVQQHGLSGFVTTGTGQRQGAQVEWFTSVVGDGKGHGLLALGFYSPDAKDGYKAALRRVLDSMQSAS
jgi:hypothetical protein